MYQSLGFPGGSAVKNLPAMQEPQEMQFQSLGQEDPLEEDTATHSSILAWGIPWTEEPGWLQPIASQRVRHNWSYLECNLRRKCHSAAFQLAASAVIGSSYREWRALEW